jgi:hypothetical protein
MALPRQLCSPWPAHGLVSSLHAPPHAAAAARRRRVLSIAAVYEFIARLMRAAPAGILTYQRRKVRHEGMCASAVQSPWQSLLLCPLCCVGRVDCHAAQLGGGASSKAPHAPTQQPVQDGSVLPQELPAPKRMRLTTAEGATDDAAADVHATAGAGGSGSGSGGAANGGAASGAGDGAGPAALPPGAGAAGGGRRRAGAADAPAAHTGTPCTSLGRTLNAAELNLLWMMAEMRANANDIACLRDLDDFECE